MIEVSGPQTQVDYEVIPARDIQITIYDILIIALYLTLNKETIKDFKHQLGTWDTRDMQAHSVEGHLCARDDTPISNLLCKSAMCIEISSFIRSFFTSGIFALTVLGRDSWPVLVTFTTA